MHREKSTANREWVTDGDRLVGMLSQSDVLEFVAGMRDQDFDHCNSAPLAIASSRRRSLIWRRSRRGIDITPISRN